MHKLNILVIVLSITFFSCQEKKVTQSLYGEYYKEVGKNILIHIDKALSSKEFENSDLSSGEIFKGNLDIDSLIDKFNILEKYKSDSSIIDITISIHHEDFEGTYTSFGEVQVLAVENFSVEKTIHDSFERIQSQIVYATTDVEDVANKRKRFPSDLIYTEIKCVFENRLYIEFEIIQKNLYSNKIETKYIIENHLRETASIQD